MKEHQDSSSQLSLGSLEKELVVKADPDRTINLTIFHRADLEELNLDQDQVRELVRFLARWLRS